MKRSDLINAIVECVEAAPKEKLDKLAEMIEAYAEQEPLRFDSLTTVDPFRALLMDKVIEASGASPKRSHC